MVDCSCRTHWLARVPGHLSTLIVDYFGSLRLGGIYPSDKVRLNFWLLITWFPTCPSRQERNRLSGDRHLNKRRQWQHGLLFFILTSTTEAGAYPYPYAVRWNMLKNSGPNYDLVALHCRHQTRMAFSRMGSWLRRNDRYRQATRDRLKNG